jgi:hypothetical protein
MKGNEMEIRIYTELIGETIAKIEGAEKGSEEVTFTLADGRKATFTHWQDCCENVVVEDVCGDINNLIDSPLTMAEEVTHDCETPEGMGLEEPTDSYTWTFYKFATIKGYVTVRWLGESNGYYSESVDFEMVAAR